MPLHGYTTPNTCIIHSAVYSLCVYCVYYYILMSFFMDLHMILTDQLFRRDIEIHSGVCRCWPHREEWNLVFCKRCHQMEAGLFFFSTFVFCRSLWSLRVLPFFFPVLEMFKEMGWRPLTLRNVAVVWATRWSVPWGMKSMGKSGAWRWMEINPLEMIWCGDFFFTSDNSYTIPYSSFFFPSVFKSSFWVFHFYFPIL